MSLGGLAIVVDGIWEERREGEKRKVFKMRRLNLMVCPRIVSAASDWLMCKDCGKRMPRPLHKQQEARAGRSELLSGRERSVKAGFSLISSLFLSPPEQHLTRLRISLC